MTGRFDQLKGESRAVCAGARLTDRLWIARVILHAHLHLGRGRRLFGEPKANREAIRMVTFRSGQQMLVRPQDAIVLFEHVGLNVYGRVLGSRLDAIKTVLDLGANTGFATLALAHGRPDMRFVCVEPAEDTRRLLRRNLELNGVRAEVLDTAVVPRDTERLTLVPAHFSAANRFIADPHGAVAGQPIDAILDSVGLDTVDLMKIDVEGAEREIFESAERWADRVGTVIAEVHDGFTADYAAALLGAHGLRRIATAHPGLVAMTR